MSPLQPVTVSAMPRAAALVRRERRGVRCGVISCLLLAAEGCSFNAEPRTGKRTDPMSEPGWTPPSAARTRDAATDASETRDAGSAATSSSNATLDAGERPNKREDAGAPAMPARPNTGQDAGVRSEKDAAAPTAPAMPDAAMRDGSEPMERDAASERTSCKPGVYSGTFSGSIQVIGLSLSTVTGTVRAKLEADASREHLEIQGARVVGVDQDGNMLTCALSGRIGCDDFQLEDGRLEDGNFHNVSSDSDTAFVGMVQAMYSEEPYSVVGTWTVEATDTSLLGGRGTWSLILSEQ